MSETRKQIKNDNGFTLVELMVTVLLTAIAVISIYRGYTAFSQAADAQQQVIEMQQNLRIGMNRLAADIRRAGMNEEDEEVAGFIAASATSVEFSMDIVGNTTAGVSFRFDSDDNDDDGYIDEEDEGTIGDGDVDDDGERIRYTLVASASGNSNDLLREVWDAASGDYGNAQTIITNVEALDFIYFHGGIEDPPPPIPPTEMVPSVEDPPGSGVFWLKPDELAIVDRVEITLVVRASSEDFRFTDTAQYANLQDDVVYDAATDAVGDDKHVRRRAANMIVQIRNNI